MSGRKRKRKACMEGGGGCGVFRKPGARKAALGENGGGAGLRIGLTQE